VGLAPPEGDTTEPQVRHFKQLRVGMRLALPKAERMASMFGEMQSMIPQLVVLAILTVATIALAIYRASVARKQDLHLHYEAAESGTVGQQIAIEHRLHTIDRWGKGLTIVTFIYFLIVVGMLVYHQWVSTYSGTMAN
jgi:hypothetical protein